MLVDLPDMTPTGTVAPTSDQGIDGDLYVQTYPLQSGVNYVDYLQSSGTQYIDTGIVGDQNTDFVFDQETTIAAWGFGSRSAAQSSALVVTSNGTSATSSNIDVGTSRVTVSNLATRRTFSLHDGTIRVNGVKIKRVADISTFFTPHSLIIFGVYSSHDGGVMLTQGGFRVYRCTIWKSGVPVGDFLPCLDNNGVACMWDNISGSYVYNSGTGSFTPGDTTTPYNLDPILWIKENGVWRITI